jgi:hypothetical protein
MWELRGEYRRVGEKRGKVRKRTDVLLHPLSIISLTIISTQRYPKVAHFKTKGWPHYFSMQMMMLSLVLTRGANMFHLLQDNPENDEQEEDEGAGGGEVMGIKLGLPMYPGPCKGTSVCFLTSPLLSYSPPVHMYFPHTSVPSLGTTSKADNFHT